MLEVMVFIISLALGGGGREENPCLTLTRFCHYSKFLEKLLLLTPTFKFILRKTQQ